MTDPSPQKAKGLFSRLVSGLSKTRASLASGLAKAVFGTDKDREKIIGKLEEVLIGADMGVRPVLAMMEDLRSRFKKGTIKPGPEVAGYLKTRIADILSQGAGPLALDSAAPFVIMVIGVNGAGKTTTIGKLAAQWQGLGKKVLVAAGDTFRAAALEQLEIWTRRSGAGLVRHASGADPSAVVFDAIEAAKARHCDILLADTAGRLHNNPNLMEELKKMKRVMGKTCPGAPHEILLILDSTNGQNVISQARIFAREIGVTGLAVTKLDGTSRGGAVVPIVQELRLPIRYIGIGEKIEDLRAFHPMEYAEALFS